MQQVYNYNTKDMEGPEELSDCRPTNGRGQALILRLDKYSEYVTLQPMKCVSQQTVQQVFNKYDFDGPKELSDSVVLNGRRQALLSTQSSECVDSTYAVIESTHRGVCRQYLCCH